MRAIIFIVHTVLQVLLVTVFLLRVLLPLSGADPRNQLSQAIIRLTNPLVLPLRRVLPPIGRIDTSSIVALLIVQVAATAVLWLLGAYPWIDQPGEFLTVALRSLVSTALHFYTFALILFVLLSWIAPGTHSPASSLLYYLCEPLLRPVRRIIPPIAGLDLSAMFVIIGLQALYIAIN